MAGYSRADSLLRQLWRRLLLAILIGAAVVGGAAVWFYHTAAERASHQEVEEATTFYRTRVSELEKEWRRGAQHFKSRLEYMRFLEDSRLRWVKLNSYLTAQFNDSNFEHLLIAGPGGDIVYRFGFGAEELAPEVTRQSQDGWYFRERDQRLFRIHVLPLWLGPDGSARMILFRPLDNALLYQMASHQTHLFLLWRGQTVASSLGEPGRRLEHLHRHGDIQHDGEPYEQRSITWVAAGESALHGEAHPSGGAHEQSIAPHSADQGLPLLVLHRPITRLFSPRELVVAGILLLTALLFFLWLATGSWAMRSASRIAALGRAAHRFIGDYTLSPEVARQLLDASQGRRDEIAEVAQSLEHLAGMVANHDDELRASETRLREITDVLADGVYVLDRAGNVTFMNPEAQRLLGWTEAELLGKNGHEMFHFRTPAGAPLSTEECPVHRTIRTGKTYRSSNDWLICRDGAVLPVTIASSPIVRDGEIVGSVAAFHDITRQQENEKKLRTASLYARSLIEASLDPLVTINQQGKITDVNAAFEQVTGETRDELVGSDFASWFTDQSGAQAGCKAVLSQGAVKDYPLSLRHISGGITDVLFNATVFRNESGEIQGVFAAARDITERKRAEAELKRLNETLEQRVAEEVARNLENERVLVQQSRLAAIGEMIGNIAHQWRQPINALGLLLANIKDAYEFEELDQAFIDKSMKTGQSIIQKMSTTIDDFRNFFKPNKEKVAFSVADALDDALNILDAALRGSSITVSVEGDRQIVAYGFRNEYSQVMLNLLANAKDVLVERKVPKGNIHITLSHTDGNARVEIADNAGGIPADILPNIFDPYFTTKAKGTGIGLYMSKMIIENGMNGSLVANNSESGACFTVITPVSGG